MKNLKLALTAIAVVATVSGALALNQKFGTGDYYCTANSDGSLCSATKDFKTGGSSTMYCSSVDNTSCTTKFTNIRQVTQ